MEPLQKTLDVIEQTKNYRLNILDNTNEIEEKFKIIDKIKDLDEKILYYNNVINNTAKDNNKILISEKDNKNLIENKINNTNNSFNIEKG